MRIVRINAGNKNVGDVVTAFAVMQELAAIQSPGVLMSFADVVANEEKFGELVGDDALVVIGGGGILGGCTGFLRFWSTYLRVAERAPHKMVLWGVGINEHYGMSAMDKRLLGRILELAEFVGVRGPLSLRRCAYANGSAVLSVVPCASVCLEPVVREAEKSIDLLIVNHMEFRYESGMPHVSIDNGTPNHAAYFVAIQRSRVVVSLSYHGVYWAFLNRIPVVPVSFSNRFDDLAELLGISELTVKLRGLDDETLSQAVDAARSFEYDWGRAELFKAANVHFRERVGRLLREGTS